MELTNQLTIDSGQLTMLSLQQTVKPVARYLDKQNLNADPLPDYP